MAVSLEQRSAGPKVSMCPSERLDEPHRERIMAGNMALWTLKAPKTSNMRGL